MTPGSKLAFLHLDWLLPLPFPLLYLFLANLQWIGQDPQLFTQPSPRNPSHLLKLDLYLINVSISVEVGLLFLSIQGMSQEIWAFSLFHIDYYSPLGVSAKNLAIVIIWGGLSRLGRVGTRWYCGCEYLYCCWRRFRAGGFAQKVVTNECDCHGMVIKTWRALNYPKKQLFHHLYLACSSLS